MRNDPTQSAAFVLTWALVGVAVLCGAGLGAFFLSDWIFGQFSPMPPPEEARQWYRWAGARDTVTTWAAGVGAIGALLGYGWLWLRSHRSRRVNTAIGLLCCLLGAACVVWLGVKLSGGGLFGTDGSPTVIIEGLGIALGAVSLLVLGLIGIRRATSLEHRPTRAPGCIPVPARENGQFLRRSRNP